MGILESDCTVHNAEIVQSCECKSLYTAKKDHPQWPWIRQDLACTECGCAVIFEILGE